MSDRPPLDPSLDPSLDPKDTVESLRREREAEFLRQVKLYVDAYVRYNKKDCQLNILNRRWNVRCKQSIGISIRELIEQHSQEFETGIGPTGGVMVRVRKAASPQTLIYMALGSGPLTFPELCAELSGIGYTVGELSDILQNEVESKRLRLADKKFSLP